MAASIDIEVFRSRLKINKHDLDGELEVHAECLERIGREVAVLSAEVIAAKDALDRIEAKEVAILKMNDPKITNPMADKEAKTTAPYRRGWLEYVERKQLHEEWAALHAAWVSRGYSLRTLADLHGQQYFTLDSTTEKQRPVDLRAMVRAASSWSPPSRETVVRRRSTT